MSRVDTVNHYYGVFFKECLPGIAIKPYAIAYEEAGGTVDPNLASSTFVRDEDKTVALIACAVLTPVLLPLTLATFAIAATLAVIGAVLAPFVYMGAAIADCHSPESGTPLPT